MKQFIIILVLIASIAIQHVTHEMSHVVSARLLKVKVTRIQWLTYQGGTRVFLEDEPELIAHVDKKWVIIAASAFLVTNILGYLMTIIYCCTEHIWLKRILCIPAIMFLAIDAIYYVLGSIGNFGDIIRIRTALRIPRIVSVLLSLCILTLNVMIILKTYY